MEVRNVLGKHKHQMLAALSWLVLVVTRCGAGEASISCATAT